MQSIQRKGITDTNVLEVMNKIPRHFFMVPGFDERAYQDNAFPIAAEQTISQPYTVAFQTSLLNIKKNDKILEIGTGSGYQTAVLLELGAKVYTVERQKELFTLTSKLFKKLNYYPKNYYGDGYKGLPIHAPFDKILITAGAPYVPETLKEQLKTGACIVVPVGPQSGQDMLRITKISDKEFKTENFGKFAFVPFLKGKN